VVNGRTQGKVDTAVAAIAGAAPGSKVAGIAADVATAAGCQTLAETLPDVDILINNAGIFEPKGFFKIPDEDWSRFFETNVMSGVRLARAYMPGMLQRNWGRIVFISSESALNIPKEMIHYGMTKTAQLAVARGLAEMTKGSSSNSFVRPRCCSASPASRRSPTWWSMSLRKRRRPPTARRCGPRAASSTPLHEACLGSWWVEPTSRANARPMTGSAQAIHCPNTTFLDCFVAPLLAMTAVRSLLPTSPPARSCRATCPTPAARARASDWRH